MHYFEVNEFGGIADGKTLCTSAVQKAVDERGLIGALTGGLTGPAGGIAAAAFFGYLFALIVRGHPKK